MIKKIIATLALTLLIPLTISPVIVSAEVGLGGYSGNFDAIEAQYGDDSSDSSSTGDSSVSDSDESETTSATTSGDNGSFELNRDFSDEELMRLYEIRQELEETKASTGTDIFATVCSVAGIIVIVYTVVLLAAFIIDKFNNFIDIELVKIVTIGHACTIKSDDDVGAVDSKMYIFTTKRMILNTLIGFIIGVSLTMSDSIIQMFYFVYDTLTGGGLS